MPAVSLPLIQKHFSELTTQELYDILQLRQQVFIVEQNCHYLDCDGKDQQAIHLLMRDGNTLVGYARLLPVGVAYEDRAAIGRYLLAKSHRGKGLGEWLFKEAIARCQKEFGAKIAISAQQYLHDFYQRLGFVATGGVYNDAGIPHIKMLYPS